MKILNGNLGDTLGYIISEFKTNKINRNGYLIQLHSNQLDIDLEILAIQIAQLGFMSCYHSDGTVYVCMK